MLVVPVLADRRDDRNTAQQPGPALVASPRPTSWRSRPGDSTGRDPLFRRRPSIPGQDGIVWVVIIRQATEQDWPLIYPICAAIVAEGKTYPFPQGQSLDEARPWWMEQPPGQTVVESNGPAVHLWQALGSQIIGTAPASFDQPEHGLVGLHIMFRHL
jgi:hypothetical protein